MARFDAALLDASEQPGIRTVALALLADAEAEYDRLALAPDAEALHDFRVAVRRLRSWLRAHREALGRSVPRAATRALRLVAQSTNERRDAEVLASWLATAIGEVDVAARPGVEALHHEVLEVAGVGSPGLPDDAAAAFAAARDALRERLPLYQVMRHLTEGERDPSFAAALAAVVRQQAMALRRRLVRIEGPSEDEAMHRARIAGKRLRYLLEPVATHLVQGAEVIARLKALQDALGDLHDSHVWLEQLRERLDRLASEESRRLTDVRSGDEHAARPDDVRPAMHALVACLRDRVREGYESFVATWGDQVRDAFLADVEHAAAALDHHGIGGVEIERKFLLQGLPLRWPPGDVQFIEQGYLPGERLIERLRRVRTREGERWYRTVKSGAGVARLELEEETTRDVFAVLWPLTLGRRVTKRRHRIPEGALVWEVDEFTDRDLVLAEVELRRVDEVVSIPVWLAPQVMREVTGEPEYVNANLAR